MNQPTDQPQSLSSKLKEHSHILVYLSAAIGIMTPAMYLMGLGFFSGYLSTFGSLSSAFPLSVIDAYVYGYYTITLYFIQVLPYITSIYALIALLAVPTFLITLAFIAIKIAKRSKSEDELELPVWLRRTVDFLSPSNNDLTKAIKIAGEELFNISRAVYITLLIISVWIGVSAYSVSKGQELALESKNTFVEKGCIYTDKTLLSTCVTILSNEGKVLNKGLLIALSGDRYGLFNNEGAIITTLPKGATIAKAFDKVAYLQQGDNSQLVASSDSE